MSLGKSIMCKYLILVLFVKLDLLLVLLLFSETDVVETVSLNDFVASPRQTILTSLSKKNHVPLSNLMKLCQRVLWKPFPLKFTWTISLDPSRLGNFFYIFFLLFFSYNTTKDTKDTRDIYSLIIKTSSDPQIWWQICP